jgi:hypothetical protein
MTTVMLNGTSYRVAASTAAKLHSGQPQSRTSAERAALGMTKPASANQAGGPTLQKASTPGTRPNAVSRCNGITVCIEVYGSGYYISAWDSQWYLSPNAYSCDSAWDWWGTFPTTRSPTFPVATGPTTPTGRRPGTFQAAQRKATSKTTLPTPQL